MSHQIKVQSSQHQFSAEADETILDAALRQGLSFAYGCRNGACGACKGKVLAGSVAHGKTLPHALTDAEKAAGLALFCCASAQSDLTIECREIRANSEIEVKTLPARIERLERLAPDVMAVFLRLPASERLQFLAGQYVDILLKEGKRRSFSLANAPHDDGLLELHIRHIPGGLFTDPLFSTIKVRDILRIEGPHGSFSLQEDSARPLLLVAGGTGFAPIKSLVEHLLHERSQRPMHLYWGARDAAGLYLAELPAQWAHEHAHLHYVPVLSAPEADWSGRSGLVHQAVLADFPDLSAYDVYICGAPAMIDAARRDFIGRAALPEQAFFADAFTLATDGQPAASV